MNNEEMVVDKYNTGGELSNLLINYSRKNPQRN